ncbi:MAG: hypothetical protein R2939_20450 [Kofleriaceae bacterium]
MTIVRFIVPALLAVVAACAAGPDDLGQSSSALADRSDVIACDADRACPRGAYCEDGLGICFTSTRCVVDGRPSDQFCERTFGDDFACLEYAADSFHCVPVEPARPELVECRTDRECPRGSACDPGLNVCLTSSRCYVEGRPSDELCERTFGDDFVCYEYAEGSHHCAPTI